MYFREVLRLESDPGRAVPDNLVTPPEFLAALGYTRERIWRKNCTSTVMSTCEFGRMAEKHLRTS